VTGSEYDDEEAESFRPAPHPDDRLWRHPSEIAALHAAQANAETAKIPAIQIDEAPSSRVHAGLKVAAGVMVIGAAALTVGVLSSTQRVTPAQVATSPVADVTDSGRTDRSVDTQIAMSATPEGQDALAARVHRQVSGSLPRIQAATEDGMREGSGFFVTEDGHVATSAALVESADYVLVWTNDGQRWKAYTVASDQVSDIAILHIESTDWPAVALAASSDFWVGQYALALDHDQNGISVGQVTAVSEPRIRVAQPAAVPGSAIVDDTGAVIAMVNSGQAANDGTRRATPAWMLEQVAVDLITHGSTTHTWLGVLVESIDDGEQTVRVAEVVADSPADRASLRAGDQIDSVNGAPITDASMLYRYVQSAQPGDDLVLTVTRNGSRRIIIAELAALPAN